MSSKYEYGFGPQEQQIYISSRTESIFRSLKLILNNIVENFLWLDGHISEKKKEKTKKYHSYTTFEKKWHQQDNKGDCFWWVHEAVVAHSF